MGFSISSRHERDSPPATNPTRSQQTGARAVVSGYRYYNADTGRWISRDPIGIRGGPNLYSFVANCPQHSIDPVGQEACTITILAGHMKEVLPQIRDGREDPGCGGRIGVVCCKPGMAQCLIDDLYPGRGIPGTPDHFEYIYCDDAAPPGARTVSEELKAVLEAAKKDLQGKCRKEPDCCDSVCVHFKCSPDMASCLSRLGKGDLCGKRICEDCKR